LFAPVRPLLVGLELVIVIGARSDREQLGVGHLPGALVVHVGVNGLRRPAFDPCTMTNAISFSISVSHSKSAPHVFGRDEGDHTPGRVESSVALQEVQVQTITFWRCQPG